MIEREKGQISFHRWVPANKKSTDEVTCVIRKGIKKLYTAVERMVRNSPLKEHTTKRNGNNTIYRANNKDAKENTVNFYKELREITENSRIYVYREIPLLYSNWLYIRSFKI